MRQDYVYSSHKGHNVSAAQLLDGSYVVVVSEIVSLHHLQIHLARRSVDGLSRR